MSNTSFKSVKSVDEHFSELNVSGNAVIHERLFVKDLIATNVLNAPAGKEIKEIDLTATLAGGTPATTAVDFAEDGTIWSPTVPISIVAAEMSFTSSLGLGNTGSLNIGVGSSATISSNIFSGATNTPVRVSSAYSQSLASSGSPDEQAMTTTDFITLNDTVPVPGNATTNNVDVKLKVYYYES